MKYFPPCSLPPVPSLPVPSPLFPPPCSLPPVPSPLFPPSLAPRARGVWGGCSILKKFVVAAKALTKSAQAQQQIWSAQAQQQIWSAQAQQLLRALKRNNGGITFFFGDFF
ncbi:hypothetical protein PL10110_170002 [Planktothrix agardhii]|nr:hypothetical protein PL10110_170002 [Planktothrix agardhii]